VLMLAVAMSLAQTLLVPLVSAGVLAFMLGP
jgi:predicted PurR-regulated permease PerM